MLILYVPFDSSEIEIVCCPVFVVIVSDFTVLPLLSVITIFPVRKLLEIKLYLTTTKSFAGLRNNAK